MNKRHPHHNFIERKLEQLTNANPDHLWNEMHSILDQKMPQKKEKRRFIAWLFGMQGLLLMTVALLITGSYLFFISAKEKSNIEIKKLPLSSRTDQFIENGSAKVSVESHENIITANESNQQNQDYIATPTSPTITGGQVGIKNFIEQPTYIQSEAFSAKEQFNEPIEIILRSSLNFDLATINSKSGYQHFLSSTKQDNKKDSLHEKATKNVKNKPRSDNENGFYTGIISGVDLSSVRFRSAKAGSTKGLIVGYAFNNKWSIESGLLWDTKRIYDNGSNFNPPGYVPSNGITIIAVNGKSRLYEWPVNVKYTVTSGQHKVFAAAGVSSYFMRTENYDYEYTQNNQPGGHNYLSYKNETKNLFSVANLSLGYTHKLGKNGSLRVEPYLKLPLTNLGVGNMPITSTGLNIGFTKKIR